MHHVCFVNGNRLVQSILTVYNYIYFILFLHQVFYFLLTLDPKQFVQEANELRSEVHEAARSKCRKVESQTTAQNFGKKSYVGIERKICSRFLDVQNEIRFGNTKKTINLNLLVLDCSRYRKVHVHQGSKTIVKYQCTCSIKRKARISQFTLSWLL